MVQLYIDMLEKLQAIKDRFNDVSELIINPEIIGDMPQYIKLNKEYKELEPIVKAIDSYIKVVEDINEAKSILKNEKDIELKEFAKLDLEECSVLKEKLDDELKILLIPKDPCIYTRFIIFSGNFSL